MCVRKGRVGSESLAARGGMRGMLERGHGHGIGQAQYGETRAARGARGGIGMRGLASETDERGEHRRRRHARGRGE